MANMALGSQVKFKYMSVRLEVTDIVISYNDCKGPVDDNTHIFKLLYVLEIKG